MERLKKPLLLICAIVFATSCFAQLQMGGWQTFFNYNNVSNIVLSKEKIFAVSDGNLFSVDKEYESIETYTKLTGLSDYNITSMAYCEKLDALVLVYNNCNIDLLKGGHIYNVPDLKRAEMSNKKVNQITIDGKYAYLSCGFGITIVDVEKNEITDTYIIGDKGQYMDIENVVFIEDSIFALGNQKIRTASKKDNNLTDFNHWKAMSAKFKNIDGIYALNDSLLILSDSILYKRDGTPILDLHGTSSLTVDKKILVSKTDSLICYNNDFETEASINGAQIKKAVFDNSTESFWFCNYQEDGQTTLAKCKKDGINVNVYIPQGPFNSKVSFIKYKGNRLITGSGGPFDLAINTPGVVQIFENNHWSVITEIGMDTSIIHEHHFLDVLDAAFDPNDPSHFYIATWKGIFEFENISLINHYSDLNSPFVKSWINIITDGLCYDKDNNLWVSNMLSPNPINVLTPEKKWFSMNYSELQNVETMKEVFVDSKGFLWVLIPRKKIGIFCANLNGTPFNGNDDQTSFASSFFDKDAHLVTPTIFQCIAEDKDGIIWIGTNKGPILVRDAAEYINSFVIDRVKITREDNSDYADYLLENEQINAIAIDGNNRKWIGTNASGLYLLSPDGKETIHHFTTENCPFTSNTIMDLALNDEAGELFIATTTGLFLFKSDATKAAESYSEAFAYPNPVTETYYGPITINGLVENSIVRISDSEGRIIHEGHSNGGTYVWDGNDFNGRRPNTGIYFIYAATEDGTSKMITKIAFIK